MVLLQVPDRLSVMTYLNQLYAHFTSSSQKQSSGDVVNPVASMSTYVVGKHHTDAIVINSGVFHKEIVSPRLPFDELKTPTAMPVFTPEFVKAVSALQPTVTELSSRSSSTVTSSSKPHLPLMTRQQYMNPFDDDDYENNSNKIEVSTNINEVNIPVLHKNENECPTSTNIYSTVSANAAISNSDVESLSKVSSPTKSSPTGDNTLLIKSSSTNDKLQRICHDDSDGNTTRPKELNLSPDLPLYGAAHLGSPGATSPALVPTNYHYHPEMVWQERDHSKAQHSIT